MKKIFMSLGIVAVIAGIIIVAVYGGQAGLGAFAGAFTNHNLDLVNDGETFTTEESAGITGVRVDSDTYSVYLRKSPTDEYSIKYVSPLRESVNVSWKTEEGVLCITQTDSETKSFDWWSWLVSANGKNDFILIEIPENVLTCEINLGFGYISAENTEVDAFSVYAAAGVVSAAQSFLGSAVIEVKTGMAIAENCTADSLGLKVKDGTVKITDTRCAGDMTVTTETGAIVVKNCEAEGAITAASNTGAIEVSAFSAALRITTDTGAIDFTTDAAHIDVEADTGSVSGKIKGVKEEYTVTVNTGTGSCNIQNQTGTEDKTLKVKVDTGAITVRFTP